MQVWNDWAGITSFPDGEKRIMLSGFKPEQKVALVKSLLPPVGENLLELCLTADALNRAGAEEITAIIPYLGYSRQNIVHQPGEALSAEVVARIIQSAPIKRIITIQTHKDHIQDYYRIPFVNISAVPLFADYFRSLAKQAIVVAADEGIAVEAKKLASQLNLALLVAKKSRDQSGKVSYQPIADVAGKNIIIFDDIISTGGTLVNLITLLKEAKQIHVGVVHHLQLPGVTEKLFAAGISSLAITDTIPLRNKEPRITQLSVTSLLMNFLNEVTK